MTITRSHSLVAAVAFLAAFSVSAPAWSGPAAAESARMARAKDLIADEQWSQAIRELRAAAADPREPNKDEALFWLAHSQNQDNDFAAAIETIRQLEREHSSSRWVKPARSLLIELAQKLKRDDVLWWTAVPPRARPLPTPRPVGPGAPAQPVPAPAPGFIRAPEAPPQVLQPVPPGMMPPPHAAPPVPATAPPAWVVETWQPDADQRILALGSLLEKNEAVVVDLLRHIALDDGNPGAGRRAVFVLAQSGKPVAQSAVVEIAKRGPEPVKLAAVRELGRFGGPEASKALLQVYSSANLAVKRQVVSSLGARAEVSALFRIAQSERNQLLRSSAIVALGRVGGREQLGRLYGQAERGSKRSIIIGLFTARAEDELIQIADKESDAELRREVLSRLRLLGTPKARAYLAREHR